MFQARQIDEVQAQTEISKFVATPGAVGAGLVVNVAAVACSVGGAGAGTGSPATFAVGDQLEVVPSAAAALNGVQVSVAPSATPGTATVSFLNPTAGSITPVAGSLYTVIATRLQPGIL